MSLAFQFGWMSGFWGGADPTEHRTGLLRFMPPLADEEGS
jgi:hypothetical protein